MNEINSRTVFFHVHVNKVSMGMSVCGIWPRNEMVDESKSIKIPLAIGMVDKKINIFFNRNWRSPGVSPRGSRGSELSNNLLHNCNYSGEVAFN